MCEHRGKLVLLPQNRVWRTYRGGRYLDVLAGKSPAQDTHFPEDWIASVTRAINIGRENINEGPSHVVIGGSVHDLVGLIASDPDYFLGSSHVAQFGLAPAILVKYIDSLHRLHLQVHPTAEFARQWLGAPHGKTEAYHILGIRPEVSAGYVYLGFQRPPTRHELRRMILEQDIAGLESCFDKVPVKVGDTFVVPGGVPHAIGPGLFLVEVQEPSDLVVRFEYARDGTTLPEGARFMGRDLEFCLDVFELTPWPRGRIEAAAICPPRQRRRLSAASWQNDLVDERRTRFFRMRQTRFGDAVQKRESDFHVGIVTSGGARITSGSESHHFGPYDKFLVPAGIGSLTYEPDGIAEILECFPPLAEPA
jgi:mannose-6-phosphate isomerase